MKAVSKNVSFDVLDGIVDKYNHTYHRTIKMKPIDVIKTILLKDMMLLMGQKKFL